MLLSLYSDDSEEEGIMVISNEWCREEKEAEWCRWPQEEREGRCSKPNNKDCRGRGPDSYSLAIRRLKKHQKTQQ